MSGMDLAYLIGAIAAFAVFGVSLAVISHAEREHHRRTSGTGQREAHGHYDDHLPHGAH